jgi:hypothetical protein
MATTDEWIRPLESVVAASPESSDAKMKENSTPVTDGAPSTKSETDVLDSIQAIRNAPKFSAAEDQEFLWMNAESCLTQGNFHFKRFEKLNLYNLHLLQHNLVKLDKEIDRARGMTSPELQETMRTTLKGYSKAHSLLFNDANG